MPWGSLGRGVALGLAGAVPVGPTGMLCIQRTLGSGVRMGLATGYASATANALYAAMAALGFTASASGLAPWYGVLKACCAVFLLRMAWRAASRPPAAGRDPRRLGCAGAYVTGLAWSLGNPLSLVGFLTLTPVMLGPGEHGWADLPQFLGGVLGGSAAWWTAVAVAVGSARRLVTAGVLLWLNRGAGVALGGLAVSLLLDAMG